MTSQNMASDPNKGVSMNSGSLSWTEKYRPQTLKQIIGNKRAVHDLNLWAESWETVIPDQKAALVYGAPGIGKTSVAHALAREMGWEVIELNASDQRTADIIERIAGAASRMSSLFSGGKTGRNARRLIILDEADNLHGTHDRGGSRAIADVIRKTNHPIILIANDPYGLTPTIRSLCFEVKFGTVQTRSIVPLLLRICESENIECSRDAAEKIAAGANGDIRGAVNDLQAATLGRTSLTGNDISLSFRDSKNTVFQALGKILRGNNRSSAMDAVFSLDETPDDLFSWVDENLPEQFGIHKNDPRMREDVLKAFDILVRTDTFLGRVRNRQVYRLWRYASFLMTVGPMSVRIDDKKSEFIKMNSPGRWRRLGQNKPARLMRNNIAIKLSLRHYDSMRECRYHLIPIYKRLMEDDETAVSLTCRDNFNMDEVAYLLNARSATKKIKKLYSDAQECRSKNLNGFRQNSFSVSSKTSDLISDTSFVSDSSETASFDETDSFNERSSSPKPIRFGKSQKTLEDSFLTTSDNTDQEDAKSEKDVQKQKSLFDF